MSEVATAVEQATEKPDETTEERRKLVAKLTARVRQARHHWADKFTEMRQDMEFAKGEQWPDQTKDDDRYVANIVKRHLHQRTAALYAKDPKAVAQRRQRLDFAVWDGNGETIMMAIQQVQEAMVNGQDPRMTMPQQMELIEDFQRGTQRRSQLDKLARTVEILFTYFIGEQRHGFKRQMKQLTRRTLTTGVGYVKVGFQREYGRDPDVESRLEDAQERLAHFQRLLTEQTEEGAEVDPAATEELQLMIGDLQDQVEFIVREGLVYDFPDSTAVIPDQRTRSIEGGFIGADWIAEQYLKTPDDIRELYDVDLKQHRFKRYDESGNESDTTKKPGKSKDSDTATHAQDWDDESYVCLWEIYDRKSGLKYTVVDGYDDFLTDPEPPYPRVDRFFPIYPLTFNQTEDEDDPYPVSDVRELRHIQREYNRSKEAVRQHRIANRPLYAGPAGSLEEGDQVNLAKHQAHAWIPLKGLAPGQSVNDVLQPVGKVNIDPNLYEVSSLYTDVLRVSGDQEANLGGTSKATATEVNVAESTRVSALASNIDDMDELLSDVARDSGKILLNEMSAEKVFEIVGPGAIWPEFSQQQLAEEVLLEIEAGSSGRPNRAQQIGNFERVAPFLLQIPGVNPQWLADYVIKILDDKLDVTDAIISGMPSMVAMNAQQQVGTGDATTDPNMQGPAGAGPGVPSGPGPMGPPQAQI